MVQVARRGEGRWLALAGAMSATGLIFHYEFGLLAPALLAALAVGWQNNRRLTAKDAEDAKARGRQKRSLAKPQWPPRSGCKGT
jgi:hypothetical protein